MKIRRLIGYLILRTLLIPTAAFALPEKDVGNLGEIHQSILSPGAHEKIYGSGWVIMAGQNVEDSDLRREGLWGSANLPDARGVFLRSNNLGRSPGVGNPHPELQCGDSQTDQIKSHGHEGRTKHGAAMSYRITQQAGLYTDNQFPERHHLPGWNPSEFSDHHDANWPGAHHTHELEIDESGGTETRPRCVIVNTFIKINRTRECQYDNTIKGCIRELPEKIATDEKWIELLRKLVREELVTNQQATDKQAKDKQAKDKQAKDKQDGT